MEATAAARMGVERAEVTAEKAEATAGEEKAAARAAEMAPEVRVAGTEVGKVEEEKAVAMATVAGKRVAATAAADWVVLWAAKVARAEAREAAVKVAAPGAGTAVVAPAAVETAEAVTAAETAEAVTAEAMGAVQSTRKSEGSRCPPGPG